MRPAAAPGAPERPGVRVVGPRPVPEFVFDPEDVQPTTPTTVGPAGASGSGCVAGRPEAPVATRAAPLAGTFAAAAVVIFVSSLLAYEVMVRGELLVHNRMLPWIVGRSLGLASYLCLTALVVMGTWLRHPWRRRVHWPRPESLLRAHVVLAAGTAVLLAGHLTAIALDRYAGVGWSGSFVPGVSHYRTAAVGLGTVGLYMIVLVGGTAALAGSIGRRVWFPIHAVSAATFSVCLVHGVAAGSDSAALGWLYVGSGCLVIVAQISRWLARQLAGSSAMEFE